MSFDCKCCGHCCEGTGGIIVSPSDLERLCGHLGLSAEIFEERFGERANAKLRVKNGADGRCIFFREGTGCAVHAAKPDICRAWPYFRGNLMDEESLVLAKDYCPGIPGDMPFADFVEEGLAYLKEHRLAAKGAGCAASLNLDGVQRKTGL